MPDNATDSAEPELEGADKQLSEDFSEALGFIKSSIAKMDRLISAILNLTREGRREFKPERIDTRELIEAIVTTVAHQAAEAEAQIRIEPLPDIVSDRLALEQIFSNLIDNALKYLKPGVPGDISIRGRTKLGFAIFEIADNGRGIDPKDHQRIFDLFRRAGTQDKPGQGIGLAHVRALVRRLGGTMSVASELHNGSTFTITLPINWAASNRNRGYMSNPVTIIMIEDDEGHARLIERNIRRSGVNNEIMPFTNGTAAVNYLFGSDGTGLDHKGQALLILLDLNLPDMTGIDILRRVKENKYLKSTPGRGADHHRRFPGNQALLRTRLQRLHHQAGELRKLRQRHSPARPVLLRHPGTASRHMNNATPTLLYIDDDAALARLVDRGLTRLGFKVVHAAGGAAGAGAPAQGGIDVVALDQYMPGLDGLETLERILADPGRAAGGVRHRLAGFRRSPSPR